jgi:alpha-amylase/alpha-mannosidase (GH57 family)
MTIALVVHGHFYQPPRENPWTGLIEREPGAGSFHDWNERIHAECYRPNAFARIADHYGRVERIVNNYARLSFNFGPTLLPWLERHAPETYARVLEADRESARRNGGHGNAIAQGYHHAILPLCNERDRRTQLRWGVRDFRLRFGREPESLWLPETACDDATLGALIEEGLRYVALSPFQAARVRPSGDDEVWRDVSGGDVDTTVPYTYFHRDGSGRSLAVFFYDGEIARGVAFEGLLASSRALVAACARAASLSSARLVNFATDGESYGHHFRYGDRCIAYALEEEAARVGLRVTNYGEFLDGNPPAFEVEIKSGVSGEGTAWSCTHGLGRWSRDCGCHAGAPEGWNQSWRGPLRSALDLLRDDLAPKFEEAGRRFFRDPWLARDDYVGLLTDEGDDARAAFFRRHAPRDLTRDERARALTLLESQRAAMAMYASCGWFFNDISGIESLQTLRHAGRVIGLAGDLNLDPPVTAFLETLNDARSNVAEQGGGADIFLRAVESSRVRPQRVAAHVALSGLIQNESVADAGESAGYNFEKLDFQKRRHGRVTLETGRLALEERATGRAYEFALAAMHFGEVDYYCALRPFEGARELEEASSELWSLFRTASLAVLLRVAQESFGPEEFGIEALLPEGQGQLSRRVFGDLVSRFLEGYERMYEESRRVVERLQEIGFQPPRELRLAAEMTLSRRLERELREQRRGAGHYQTAGEIAREASRFGYQLERAPVTRVFEETVTEAARTVVARPTGENVRTARALIELGRELGLEANLERAQEVIYEAAQAGANVSDEWRDFALALGLAPVALSAARLEREREASDVSSREREAAEVSSVETTLT